ALRGADAAADALVGVHHAAPAAQAAGGLGPDLLGREGHALVLHGEHLRRVYGGLRARRLAEAVRGQGDVLLVQLPELAQVAVDGQRLALVDEAVDGDGPLAARGYGVNGV